MAQTSTEAHALVRGIGETKHVMEQVAKETGERIDGLVEDARELADRTEANARELTTHNATAKQLVDRLDTMKEPAETLVSELAQRSHLAEQHNTTLLERCDQAGRLADRLNAVTRVLHTANDIAETLKTTTIDAGTIHDELSSASNDASQKRDQLQTLTASARDLLETHERIKLETRSESERLGAQLASMQASIEAGQPLMDDFTSQTQVLEQRLADLEGNTREVEHTLREMTARPTRVVEIAQAQAAELERVCGAVKKVFAGLSKTSLDARKHASDCKQANVDATRLLASLSGESNRIVTTLNEWVAEALRAQSRLEKTLEQCPTIQQTHPSDAIAPVAQPAQPTGRIIKTKTGKTSDLAMPTEQVITSATPTKTGTATKPTSRAEEISRMIEEAKCAAVSADG